MTDFQFIVIFVAVSAAWGGLWWLLLRYIAGLESVKESDFLRRAFKGLGLFIGIGLPTMAALVTALHFYI